MVTIYTDGSVRGRNPSAYGAWAALLIAPNGTEKLISGMLYGTEKEDSLQEDVTNNTAEIAAIHFGLKAIKYPSITVKIISDSMYAIEALNGTYPRGCRTDPLTGQKLLTKPDGSIIKNNEWIVNTLDYIHQQHLKVEYKHVRGHQGVENNERVHTEAYMVAKGLKEATWVASK